MCSISLLLILTGSVIPTQAKPSTKSVQVAPRPIDVLKAGLAFQDNPVVRAEAVEALELIATPEVLPWIRTALLDDHPGVRFAACMVLGRLKDAGAASVLRKALYDRDDNVRVAAIFGLHQIGQTDQTDRLPNYVLLHSDPVVRRNAAIAISLLGRPSAVMVLARAMKDTEPGVRYHALEGMARLGNKDAARELSFMVNSGVGSDEVFALNALAATNDPVHEDAFRYKLANATHIETRLSAAGALGNLGIDAGLPVVLDALKPNIALRNDPDDPSTEQLLRIRQLALAAAGKIGDPSAILPIEPYFRDGIDPRIQISAARALVEIESKPNRGLFSKGRNRR